MIHSNLGVTPLPALGRTIRAAADRIERRPESPMADQGFFYFSVDSLYAGEHNFSVFYGVVVTFTHPRFVKASPSLRTDMSQRSFSLVTAAIFALIALLHVSRLLGAWQVTIGGLVVPLWVSWTGLAIAATLACVGFWLSRTASQTTKPPQNVTNEAIRIAQAEEETLQKLLFHVNEVFHARVNFFLVAESIFFAALAALWKEGTPIKLVICGLGLAITVVLWFSIFRLNTRGDYLTSLYREVSPVYKLYLESAPLRPVTIGRLFTYGLSVIMLIGWLLILRLVLTTTPPK
jgi:hypothetical protein